MNDGKKKRPQKHQNKTAFKIVFDPQAIQKHKKVSFKSLCKRCADQISWKLQYNKYKKMTEAGKCLLCLQKTVYRSYMRACQPCTEAKGICPKCLESEAEEQIEVKKNELQKKLEEQETEKRMNDYLKSMRERSRRTVKRGYEKGTITWSQELGTFVDAEGNQLIGLQFRKGCGDANEQSDEDGDDLIDDDEEDEDDGNKEDNEEDKGGKDDEAIDDKNNDSKEDEAEQDQQDSDKQDQDNDLHEDIKQVDNDDEPAQQEEWEDEDEGNHDGDDQNDKLDGGHSTHKHKNHGEHKNKHKHAHK